MIYWLAAPVYCADYSDIDDVPEVNRDGHRFVSHVLKMLMEHRFQHNRISFDPSSVWSIGERRRIEEGCGIPPELIVPNC